MVRRFYDALEEALEFTGWSIPYLCGRAGVSKDQVTKFMQRSKKGLKASTNVDDAVKLANALGMTVDEMVQDDTAVLRSESARLWRELSSAERELLRAVERGRNAEQGNSHQQSPVNG